MSLSPWSRARPLLLAILLLSAALLVVGCGGPTPPKSSRLALQPTSLSLRVGESATVTATLGGAATTAVEWTSSNVAIATVDDGVVTAVAVGSTVITAQSTAEPTETAQLNVTVTTGTQPVDPGVVVKTAGGQHHSVALLGDGSVVTWGANLLGQLGIGVQSYFSTHDPVEVSLSDVVDIAAGDAFTLALLADGTVWGWGSNAMGQLGASSTATIEYTPIQIAGVSEAVSVSAAANSAFAVLDDGTVVGWGSNANGALGRGDFLPASDATPTAVVGLTDVSSLSAGGTSGATHVLALRDDGTVWAWGGNMSGELGVEVVTPARATAGVVPGLSGVVQVAAGSGFSLALKSDGTVLGWGGANVGQLGAGTVGASTVDPVEADVVDVAFIAAGQQHAMAVHEDGAVSSWGANTFGQLGIGSDSGFRLDPQGVTGLGDVVGVSAGVQHSLAVDADGQVWAWGSNLSLQSGVEAGADSTSPNLLW